MDHHDSEHNKEDNQAGQPRVAKTRPSGGAVLALVAAIGAAAGPAASCKGCDSNVKDPTESVVTSTDSIDSMTDIDWRKKANELWLKKAKQNEAGGDFAYAAEFYRIAGDFDKAKEMWLKVAKQQEAGGHFFYAAETYRKAGDFDKAKEIWLKEAQQKEAGGDFSSAAETYREAGDTDKAKEMWLKVAQQKEAKGDFREVAYVYEKIAQLYEKSRK